MTGPTAPDIEHHRGTCITAVDDAVYVGSSEARLFRVADRGLEPLVPLEFGQRVAPLGTRPGRSAGHAIDRELGRGGLRERPRRRHPSHARTRRAWTPTIEIDADVHQVTTAEGLVLAASAGGLAVSADRGSSWTLRTDGLERLLEAPWPSAATRSSCPPSNGPRGGRARSYRGGRHRWSARRCRSGLPEWFDDNIDSYCLDALPDGSLVAFGTSDGRVFASEDAGVSWAAEPPPGCHRYSASWCCPDRLARLLPQRPRFGRSQGRLPVHLRAFPGEMSTIADDGAPRTRPDPKSRSSNSFTRRGRNL